MKSQQIPFTNEEKFAHSSFAYHTLLFLQDNKPQWCLLSAIVLKAEVGSLLLPLAFCGNPRRVSLLAVCVFLYFASSARTHNQASHNILSLSVYSLKLRVATERSCSDRELLGCIRNRTHSFVILHSDCIKRALQIATNNIHTYTQRARRLFQRCRALQCFIIR